MSEPRPRGFHGGVRVPRQKDTLHGAASRPLPAPSRLVYPLDAHIGTGSVPVVQVGQRVRAGETIAMPGSYVSQAIHAAAAGLVTAIGEFPVVHGGASSDRCIVIGHDGRREGILPMPALDPDIVSPEALQARIADAGLIGMGGAGFPSHVKLREGQRRRQDQRQGADLLIINGVECEPMIASDECLMRERAADVVDGARVLMRAVGASRCIVAIENDMEAALAAMQTVATGEVTVVGVPDIYPAGGEKQLIRTLTGAEVPTHSLPIDVGVVMHNVATAVAAADAVLRGLPLTERVVCVAGAVAQPANLRVPLGTPIRHLIDAAGGAVPGARIIVGGPMMGFAIDDLDVPVVKTTNAVIALADGPVLDAMPCIRCGDCVDVCPAQLQPQALYEFVGAGDWDSAQDYHLFDCIECGACAYVCPSHLPLVAVYRHGKSTIDERDRAQARADLLRGRHHAHVARLGADAVDDPVDAADTVVDVAAAADATPTQAMQAEIAAARARVRARREAMGGTMNDRARDEPSAAADGPAAPTS